MPRKCVGIGSDGMVRGCRRGYGEATGEGHVIKTRYKGSPGSPVCLEAKLQLLYTVYNDMLNQSELSLLVVLNSSSYTYLVYLDHIIQSSSHQASCDGGQR